MRRIGNPTGLRGVWLTPGAAVKHRFRVGMRHDSQKSLLNDSANLLHPRVESKAKGRPLRNGNRRITLHKQYRIVMARRWPLLLHSRRSAGISWRLRFSGCYGARHGLNGRNGSNSPTGGRGPKFNFFKLAAARKPFKLMCQKAANGHRGLPASLLSVAAGRSLGGSTGKNVEDRLGRTTAMEGRRQAMLIAGEGIPKKRGCGRRRMATFR